MTKPLVTICVTTYNRKNLLPLTVESVLKQNYSNFELLIIDDFSTDGTQYIAAELETKDKRIKYIRHKKNNGLAAARNTAIFNAKGKYFTFIDDDDIWKQNFIKEFVKLAEKYDENWCFCCGSKDNNTEKIPKMEGLLSYYIKQGFTPPVASQFYFTKSLREINGYNEKIKSGVDHDLWLKLSFVGTKIKSVEKVLAIPNIDENADRMTTNYKKRITKIKQSFDIWQDDIVEYYGKDFLKHFKTCYYHTIYKKFIKNNLHNHNILNVFKLFLDCPQKIKFLIFILKKTKNYNIVQPTFPPYTK